MGHSKSNIYFPKLKRNGIAKYRKLVSAMMSDLRDLHSRFKYAWTEPIRIL